MTTPPFHHAAAQQQADIAEHAKQTAAAADHALELIDEVLAGGGWKADFIHWIQDQ